MVVVRYFMHLRNGGEELLDTEGTDVPNLAALREALTRATKRGLRRIDQKLLAEVYAAFETTETPQPLAFDAELEPDVEATDENIASLAMRLRNRKIDEASNPFACDREQLTALWEKRREE